MIRRILLATILIHLTWFIIWAILLLCPYLLPWDSQNTIFLNILVIFLPQYMLVYFLPPAWPQELVAGQWVVNYWNLAGKFLVSLPASFIYAIILYGVWVLMANLKRRIFELVVRAKNRESK